MPVFHLAITDGGNAEMEIECETAREAVSRALHAMSGFVYERPDLPGDITIIVRDIGRSQVASINVTFPFKYEKSIPH